MKVIFKNNYLPIILTLPGMAFAQPASTGSGHAYPTKPIRIIVAYTPAGAPTSSRVQ